MMARPQRSRRKSSGVSVHSLTPAPSSSRRLPAGRPPAPSPCRCPPANGPQRRARRRRAVARSPGQWSVGCSWSPPSVSSRDDCRGVVTSVGGVPALLGGLRAGGEWGRDRRPDPRDSAFRAGRRLPGGNLAVEVVDVVAQLGDEGLPLPFDGVDGGDGEVGGGAHGLAFHSSVTLSTSVGRGSTQPGGGGGSATRTGSTSPASTG